MSVVSRRVFLGGAAVAGVAMAVGCSAPSSVSAVDGRRRLPIPPLAEATVGTDGVRRFELVAQSGSSEITAGVVTPTWGYNGDILGPTLRARRGQRVQVAVRNDLAETTTVHWHGMHVPATCDGGPHQPVGVGQTWEPAWTVDQPAATLWYHPHPHGLTEQHAQRGLAGLFIVDDDAADAVGLPSEYGVDDIPIIVQDRRFLADGALDLSSPTNVGLLGDVIVVNGMRDVYLPVTTGSVRLRLLNGSSGRIYTFGLADGSPLVVVASDGGLLARPASVDRLTLSPGERAEVLVSLAGDDPVMLRSCAVEERGGIEAGLAATFGFDDAFDILELRPERGRSASKALPDSLIALPALAEATTERRFDLKWFMINRRRMDMSVVDERVPVDTDEIWVVTNEDNWPHNFHIHDTQFRIVDVDGRTPPPEIDGWKDTVYVPVGSVVSLAVRFRDYTDPVNAYMYHCHMMFHEDQGMMGQFVVVGRDDVAAPDVSGADLPMHAGH